MVVLLMSEQGNISGTYNSSTYCCTVRVIPGTILVYDIVGKFQEHIHAWAQLGDG